MEVTSNLPPASLCLKGSFCCFVLPKLLGSVIQHCQSLSAPISSQCEPLDTDNSDHHMGSPEITCGRSYVTQHTHGEFSKCNCL